MTSLVIAIRDQAATADQKDTTTRIYAAQWQKWEFWTAANGADSADLSRLEEYLEEMRERGASMSAIKQARAGVLAFYREWMDSIRKKPAGITQDGLEAIRATAPRPRPAILGKRETNAHARVRAQVDVALVSVMRDAMLRPSEAATITWGNISRDHDGSGTVYVQRARDPVGQDLYLGPPTMRALNAISPLRTDPRDLVFELSTHQITRRIKAVALSAGLRGHFTGDSPRLGMFQDLAAARGAVALYYTAIAA